MSTVNFTASLWQGLALFVTLVFPGPCRKRPGQVKNKDIQHLCDRAGSGCPENKAETGSTLPPTPSSSESTSAGDSGEQWSQVSTSRVATDAVMSSPSSSMFTISSADAEMVSEASTTTTPMVTAFFELVHQASAPASAKKLVQKTVRLLDQCDYLEDEVCSVLAHASAYFEDIYTQCGHRMTSNEVGYIMVVLIYIAHCHVLDEACPLRLWHQHLCKRYCSLSMLDAAVMRLMKMRNYRTRLSEDDFETRYSPLLSAAGLTRVVTGQSDFWLRGM